MQDLVILGAGGLARETAFLVRDINSAAVEPPWNLVGYLEQDRANIGRAFDGLAVLGDDSYLVDCRTPIAALAAMGWPSRLAIAHAAIASAPLVTRPCMVHPTVVYDRSSVTLGVGVILCAGVILTTGVTIDEGTIANPQCTCGHDTRIGRHCVLNPGANVSGDVVIGDRCLIGAGAVILQGVCVGDDAVVGAGAVVTRDVPAGATVVGIPARALSGPKAPKTERSA